MQQFVGDLNHAAVADVQGIERARHDNPRRSAGGANTDALDFGQEKVLPRGRRLEPRLVHLLAFEQFELEPRGDAARLGHGVEDQATGKPLLFRPAAAALVKLQPPGGGLAGRLQGDVDAVRTAFRPIGGQAGRTGHPGRQDSRLLIAPAVLEGHHGHGAGRGGRAEFVGPAAQPGRQGRGRVRDNGLEEGSRTAGHGQQVGNRPAAASRDREHDAAGRVVNLFNELFGREKHFAPPIGAEDPRCLSAPTDPLPTRPGITAAPIS